MQSGYADSAVASGVYNIQCVAPTFSPAAGTYASAQTVTISTTTTGATINYTTNGITPSSTVGTIYSSPININVNTTLQAIAYMSGMGNSPVTSGNYYIPMRRTDLQPGGGHLQLRAERDDQYHDRRGDYPLHHRRQHPVRDRRHGVQHPGAHRRQREFPSHRLHDRHARQPGDIKRLYHCHSTSRFRNGALAACRYRGDDEWRRRQRLGRPIGQRL